MKQVKLDPDHPEAKEILRSACYADSADVMKILLAKGFNPNDRENGGSTLISILLNNMTWSIDFDLFSERPKKHIDTSKSREKIKMIHLLVHSGAKWIPRDRNEINDARRALLKMKADYAVEFIWIMSQYKACSREDAEQLMRTPSIRSLCSQHLQRIEELIQSL
jgi:hypothetical protein